MKEIRVVYDTLKQACIAFDKLARIAASSYFFCKVHKTRREVVILIPYKEDVRIRFTSTQRWNQWESRGFRGVMIPGSEFDPEVKRKEIEMTIAKDDIKSFFDVFDPDSTVYTKTVLTKDDIIEPTDFDIFDPKTWCPLQEMEIDENGRQANSDV